MKKDNKKVALAVDNFVWQYVDQKTGEVKHISMLDMTEEHRQKAFWKMEKKMLELHNKMMVFSVLADKLEAVSKIKKQELKELSEVQNIGTFFTNPITKKVREKKVKEYIKQIEELERN